MTCPSSALFLALAMAAAIVTAMRLYLITRFKPSHPDRDEISHLTFLRGVIENNYRIPTCYPRFVLNENTYPHGYHYLLALTRLPFEFWEKNGKYLPLILNVMLLFWTGLLLYVTQAPSPWWLLLFPLIRVHWDKNTSIYFSERAWGVFFGSLYLTASFMWIQTGQWEWLIPSLIGFAITSTSSRFGNQAMAFFTLFLTVADWNMMYLLTYLGHLLITIPLSKGYVLRVLRGQIQYSIFYQQHRAERYLFVNHYKNFFNVFSRRKTRTVLFSNPLFMTFTACCINLPFILLLVTTGWPETPFMSSLAIFGLGGIFLNFIIATEWFKFLGQPERYLEFAVVPVLLFLAQFPVSEHPWPFAAGLLMGLAAVLWHFEGNIKKTPGGADLETRAYHDLAEFLSIQPEGLILPIHLKVAHYMHYISPRHRFLSSFVDRFDPRYVTDLFPYPGHELEKYVRQYDVDYIMLLKRTLGKINKFAGGEYYDFSPFEILYENESFTLYRVKPEQRA